MVAKKITISQLELINKLMVQRALIQHQITSVQNPQNDPEGLGFKFAYFVGDDYPKRTPPTFQLELEVGSEAYLAINAVLTDTLLRRLRTVEGQIEEYGIEVWPTKAE